MLKLIIEDDEGKTTVVPLIRDEITIGRKEGNTIRLTERNISRRHARLARRNGQVFLEDLDSYNGIRLNGQRIQGQVAVKEGDRIQIGDYQLGLKIDQPAAAAAPADPFDEMKTIPVEKAESRAMAAHLAATTPGAPPPAMVAPMPVEAPAAPPGRNQNDLIAEAAAAKSRETPARLVVVSSNFAGLECVLDKSAQVVGRTEENDIVINHRSISRNHAKIVHEGPSYIIEDQASANGIYVNGERYDRIELHSGDMVDLGHVRLRFVAPGEVFAFDPSMVEDVGPTPRKSGTTLFVILGILLVAGAAAGILYATGAFSGKKKSVSKPDDSMAAMEPGSQKDPKSYQAIQTLLTQKDWKSAIRDADALLIKDQQDPEAKRLRDKAVEEQKNEELKNLFFSALRDGDRGKAFEEGSKIPSDSVYHAEVSARLEQEKLKLKDDLVAKAKELHRTNRCPELSEISKKIHAVDPAETSVSALLRSCKAPEVADAMTPPGTEDPMRDTPPPRDMSTDPPPDRPRTMDPPPPMDPERPPPAGGAAAAAELYEQARKAWLGGDCSKAITLADEANRKQFSSRHVSIIGACACTLGNQGRANWAYKILKGGQRNILVQVCKSKGINLP